MTLWVTVKGKDMTEHYCGCADSAMFWVNKLLRSLKKEEKTCFNAFGYIWVKMKKWV